MSNNDITKMFVFVGSVIGGVLAVVMIIYNTVYNPLNTAIAQEAYARANLERQHNKDIREQNDKLNTAVTEQTKTNGDVKAVLEKILTKLDNIEKKVR